VPCGDRRDREWDPETLIERPWDIEHTRRMFAEADARARK
jgi:hypothetical protein